MATPSDEGTASTAPPADVTANEHINAAGRPNTPDAAKSRNNNNSGGVSSPAAAAQAFANSATPTLPTHPYTLRTPTSQVRVLRRPAALLAASSPRSAVVYTDSISDGVNTHSEGCWKSVPVHAHTTLFWSGHHNSSRNGSSNTSSSSSSSSDSNPSHPNDRRSGEVSNKDNRADRSNRSGSLGSGTTASSSLNSVTCSTTPSSTQTSKDVTAGPTKESKGNTQGQSTTAVPSPRSFLDARDASAVVHYPHTTDEVQKDTPSVMQWNSDGTPREPVASWAHIDDPFHPHHCHRPDDHSAHDVDTHSPTHTTHRHRHRHHHHRHHRRYDASHDRVLHHRHRHGEHGHASAHCLRAWDSYPGCTGRVMEPRDATRIMASSHHDQRADPAVMWSEAEHGAHEMQPHTHRHEELPMGAGQPREERDTREAAAAAAARLRAFPSPLFAPYRRPILLPATASPMSSAAGNVTTAHVPTHFSSNNNNTSPAHALLQQQLHHHHHPPYLPMAQISSQRGHAVDHVRVEQLAHRLQSIRGIVSVMKSSELPEKFYMNMLSFLMFSQEIVRQQRVMMMGPVACYLNLRARTFIVADFIPIKTAAATDGTDGSVPMQTSSPSQQQPQTEGGVSDHNGARSHDNHSTSNKVDGGGSRAGDTAPSQEPRDFSRTLANAPDERAGASVRRASSEAGVESTTTTTAYVTTSSHTESEATRHNSNDHTRDTNSGVHSNNTTNTTTTWMQQNDSSSNNNNNDNDNSKSTRALQATMDALQAAYAMENHDDDVAAMNSSGDGNRSTDVPGTRHGRGRHRDKAAAHSASEVCLRHGCSGDAMHASVTTRATRRSEFHRLPSAAVRNVDQIPRATAAAAAGVVDAVVSADSYDHKEDDSNNNNKGHSNSNSSSSSSHACEYRSMPVMYHSHSAVADEHSSNRDVDKARQAVVVHANDAKLNLDFFLSEEMIAHLQACDGVLHFYRRGAASLVFPFITRERLAVLKKMSAVRLSSIKGLAVFGVLLANALTEEAVAAGGETTGQADQSIIPLQYDVDSAHFEKVTETKQSAAIPRPAASPVSQTATNTNTTTKSTPTPMEAAEAAAVIDVPTLQSHEATVATTRIDDDHKQTSRTHVSQGVSDETATHAPSSWPAPPRDTAVGSSTAEGSHTRVTHTESETGTESPPVPHTTNLPAKTDEKEKEKEEDGAQVNQSEMQLPRILAHRMSAHAAHAQTPSHSHHHSHPHHTHTHIHSHSHRATTHSSRSHPTATPVLSNKPDVAETDRVSPHAPHTASAAEPKSGSWAHRAGRSGWPISTTDTTAHRVTPTTMSQDTGTTPTTTTTLFSGYTVPSSASAALDGYSTALKFLQSYNSATLDEQQQRQKQQEQGKGSDVVGEAGQGDTAGLASKQSTVQRHEDSANTETAPHTERDAENAAHAAANAPLQQGHFGTTTTTTTTTVAELSSLSSALPNENVKSAHVHGEGGAKAPVTTPLAKTNPTQITRA